MGPWQSGLMRRIFNPVKRVHARSEGPNPSWNWKGTSLPPSGVAVCESEEAEGDGRPESREHLRKAGNWRPRCERERAPKLRAPFRD